MTMHWSQYCAIVVVCLVLSLPCVVVAESEIDLDIDGDLFAFGDFNSDKHTDLFVVSEDRTTMTVYEWGNNRYKKTPYSITTKDIVQVVPLDFNRDGALDVLVASESNGFYSSMIYLGRHKKLDTSPITSINSTSQLLVFDFNNDLKPDFIGNSINGQQTVWILDESLKLTETKRPSGSLSQLHASAFVDLDGDCAADLLTIENESCTKDGHMDINIWLNGKSSSFPNVPKMKLRAPCHIQQIALADMDRNGAVDIVYADLEDNTIHIIYNQQKPVCNTRVGSSSKSCRSPTNLCSSDPNFTFGDPMNPKSKNHVVFEIEREVMKAQSQTLLTLRIGDWNLDGYPDIFLPLIHPEDGKPYLNLFLNVRCNDGKCGSHNGDLRTLDIKTRFKTPYAYAAAVTDYREDGIGDLIVLTKPSLFNSSGVGSTIVYENPANSDSFFLKAMALNGLCMSWCPTSPKFPDPRPYGVNQAGATFKFTVTELDGTKHVRQGTQLSQSSHLALQPPYTLFGLGRTNNYVEEFFLGMPLQQSKNYAYWIAIVPNSRLIAAPYKPSDPATWQLELYVSPSSQLLWVSVAVLVSLVVVGIIILILEYKERKEDEAEKKATAHLFSFDAL